MPELDTTDKTNALSAIEQVGDLMAAARLALDSEDYLAVNALVVRARELLGDRAFPRLSIEGGVRAIQVALEAVRTTPRTVS